ncbi:polyunsaturated fatty acid 5-lipoxygenase-like [Conger conger]|uniref:polyunsaturated fatty acid 5-lipoxygenase-like n=1 Tax=Conger conger TaxID=82655 RepID=UPI002A5AD4E8|nr:polyunsaturated fatty acid 5-lipoxygenase-like [Conger conger]
MIFRKLWNFRRKWEEIDDIKNVFWFPSKKAAYVAKNWKEDTFFGKQFLHGCNPIMIEKYKEGQQKIPVETLEKVYPDIEENIKNGRIYVVDYWILDKIAAAIFDTPQFLAAPIMLLQQTANELNPIAIQLKQEPGEDNPVFTPQDNKAWLLAKIWVRNSDFYYHELVSHLLRTHLMGEIFFIASYYMADQHPISRILRETGRYTLPINITARNTLINTGGFFVEYTAIGKEHWEVLKRATKKITYKSLCLPDNVKQRGIDKLKNFHYRDDGMDIWEAIYEFVRGVVNGLYKNDEDIQKDPELQQMVSFIYNYGFLQKPDCPSSLKTREEAIKYITMIMFTCSAQHAAVNHGQYDIYAWMPNGPTTMRKPPPKDKKVTEKDIMDTLPDITTTLEAMKVARFLSQVPKDFVPLGNYPEEVANESYMRGPLREFQKTLTEIGTKIRERSTQESEREFPSEYLDPAGMENSITI